MKKQDIFLLLLLLLAHFLPAQKIWEAQNLNLPKPQMGLPLDVATANAAWMAVEGGDFTTCPWTLDFTQNTFSRTKDGKTWVSGAYPHNGPGIMTDIWAFDDNLARISFFDFVDGNLLLKTSDGGQNWVREDINVTTYIDFVQFFGISVGLVVGDPDTLGFEIFTTVSLGNSWQRINPALVPAALPNEAAWPYHAVDGKHIWFITSWGRIYHSPSQGVSWEVWNGPKPGVLIDAIACHDGTCVIAFNTCDSLNTAHRFQMFRTNNEGKNWKNITPPDSLFSVGQLRLIPTTGALIGSFRGNNVSGPFQTRISYDDGEHWKVIDEGTPVYNFDFLDSLTGYATHYQTGTETPVIYKYVGPTITTGLSKYKPLDAEVSLTPNPTDGLLRVKVQGDLPGGYLLSVSDAFGRVVQRKNIDKGGNLEETVDLSGLPAGLYFVVLNLATGRYCSKVVKQ